MQQRMLVGLTALALLAGDARGDGLAIGDPAPRLDKVRWVQGRPVKRFSRGKVYVVDFWSSWCATCVDSVRIAADVAREFRKQRVVVVGVAIAPLRYQPPTDAFVERWKDVMDYPVAEDVNGATVAAFMGAKRDTIPHTYIIDKKGRIAWIGNPLRGLRHIVRKVLEGGFDGKADRSAQEETQEEADPIWEKIDKARKYGFWDDVLAGADRVLAIDSGQRQAWLDRYQSLVHLGEGERAAAWGREAVDGPFSDSAYYLAALARFIVREDDEIEPAERDLELAHDALQRARELVGDRVPGMLVAAARFCHLNGETAEAARLQQEAIDLAYVHKQKEAWGPALEEYRTAMEDS